MTAQIATCRRREFRATAVASVVATLGFLGLLTACSDTTGDFCDGLRDNTIEDLSQAIRQKDERGITEGLTKLRELQDVAPASISNDFTKLIDTTSDVVRSITGAPGSDGEGGPIDQTALGNDLAEVQKSAQEVASFADRECGLKLNP